jgi:hypothetical protein
MIREYDNNKKGYQGKGTAEKIGNRAVRKL